MTHRLIALSADDPATLDDSARRLGAALAEQPGLPVDELARSLAARPVGGCRLAFVATSTAAAAETLLDGFDGFDGRQGTAPESVVFLLPGVGEQAPGMAAGLYETVPAFRSAFDRCAAAGSAELADLVRPADGAAAPSELAVLLGRHDAPAERTRTAQLGMVAVEYALAAALADVGVRPTALLGYSVGEYTAAALAGVLPVEDLAPLVAARAELIETTEPGGMLVVLLGADDVADRLAALGDRRLVVSAIDAPGLCVVSGPRASVDELAEHLTGDLVATRRLPVRHAFHSPLLSDVADPLRDTIDRLGPRAPSVPALSNVTGGWWRAEDVVTGAYWARHLTEPVRFADNLDALWRLPDPLVIEVGPGKMLGTLATAHPGRAGRPVLATVPTPRQGGSDVPGLLAVVGAAWTSGLPVDLRRLSGWG